jgi:hypothetical protein
MAEFSELSDMLLPRCAPFDYRSGIPCPEHRANDDLGHKIRAPLSGEGELHMNKHSNHVMSLPEVGGAQHGTM